MSGNIYNVLFLCAGNSAHLIQTESSLEKASGSRFEAHSAGRRTKVDFNPHAQKELESLRCQSTDFSSKSWDVLADPEAPEMDYIFAVCDSAVGESCPDWISPPIFTHWGVEAPRAVPESEVRIQRACTQSVRFLKNRIPASVSPHLASIDRIGVETKPRQIGTMEGSTSAEEKSPDVHL